MSFVIEFLAAFLLKTCLLLLFCYPENICDIVFSLELQFSVKVQPENKPKCKQLTTEVFWGLTAVIPLTVTLRMLVSRLLSPAGPAPQLGMADMWNMALFLFYLSLVCKGYWWRTSSPVIQQRRQVAWVSDWKYSANMAAPFLEAFLDTTGKDICHSGIRMGGGEYERTGE